MRSQPRVGFAKLSSVAAEGVRAANSASLIFTLMVRAVRQEQLYPLSVLASLLVDFLNGGKLEDVGLKQGQSG